MRQFMQVVSYFMCFRSNVVVTKCLWGCERVLTNMIIP